MSLYNYYYIEKSDNLDDLNESTIDKLKIIIDKLSKFIPEIFLKITQNNKNLDPKTRKKCLLMHRLFEKIFIKNETNVHLDVFSGLRPLLDYLKNFKTIEMVVIVLALAFIVSKIFDMFRVKVEV